CDRHCARPRTECFGPTPLLTRLAGQKLPSHFRPVITPMGETDAPLLASRRRWARHGSSGLWVSDWYPHIATCADDLAVIRSCWANRFDYFHRGCPENTR